MYKCINCLTPQYQSDILTTVSNMHNHNTYRSSRNDMATVKPKNNDNDKVFYSTLIIHFIFNTATDVFAY